jgi:pimeloyl-ACP methyl ester carboxylesterase
MLTWPSKRKAKQDIRQKLKMLPEIASRKSIPFNGRIDVPTLGIRGNVDGCIPEVAWELTSPKSFRAGLTLEVMPGDIGHFPQLENPEWISERLIRWVGKHSN